MKKNFILLTALSAMLWSGPATAMRRGLAPAHATGLANWHKLGLYGAAGLGADYLARKENSLVGRGIGKAKKFGRWLRHGSEKGRIADIRAHFGNHKKKYITALLLALVAAIAKSRRKRELTYEEYSSPAMSAWEDYKALEKEDTQASLAQFLWKNPQYKDSHLAQMRIGEAKDTMSVSWREFGRELVPQAAKDYLSRRGGGALSPLWVREPITYRNLPPAPPAAPPAKPPAAQEVEPVEIATFAELAALGEDGNRFFSYQGQIYYKNHRGHSWDFISLRVVTPEKEVDYSTSYYMDHDGTIHTAPEGHLTNPIYVTSCTHYQEGLHYHVPHSMRFRCTHAKTGEPIKATTINIEGSEFQRGHLQFSQNNPNKSVIFVDGQPTDDAIRQQED